MTLNVKHVVCERNVGVPAEKDMTLQDKYCSHGRDTFCWAVALDCTAACFHCLEVNTSVLVNAWDTNMDMLCILDTTLHWVGKEKVKVCWTYLHLFFSYLFFSNVYNGQGMHMELQMYLNKPDLNKLFFVFKTQTLLVLAHPCLRLATIVANTLINPIHYNLPTFLQRVPSYVSRHPITQHGHPQEI